ncbi:SulP family inorganic anion transporter [Gryllotalpicola reticulitermitis]|uniref:SulP family inorganic anion transporter n=1 Tax=Gryllotalpicola reticulitermitis TaxID=1184153 RepID=A0ABV8QAP4_9MICO
MPLLAGANRHTWRGEALMGITLAAMSAPVAMAFAGFAGLPPMMGLYALIVPGVIFAFFTGTGRLTAAPDAVLVALIVATLTPFAAPGTHRYVELAIAQSLLAAVAFLVMTITRVSRVAVLLPRPMLVGLSAAIAADFLAREIAAMFGIRLGTRITGAAGNGFLHIGTVLAQLGDADVWAVAVAAGALVILLVGRRIGPRLPWELAVYLVTYAAYHVFGLSGTGVGTIGSAGGGASGGGPQLAVPALNGSEWFELIPGALVLVVVAFAQHQDADPGYQQARSRDGIAYAAANAASGLTGGFAIGPSPARRARLDELRSTSQLPTVVAALLILVTLVFWGDFLGDIPLPAFAAIAAVATWPLLRLREVRTIWRASKSEFVAMLLVFAVTLVFGALWGVAATAGFGALRMVAAASAPPIDVVDADGRPIASLRPGSPAPRATARGVSVVRFAAPIQAAAAGSLVRGVRSALNTPDGRDGSGIRHLVLDCEAIGSIDTTGAQVLRHLLAEAAQRGISVDYCRTRAVLRVELERHGLLGGSHVFRTVREALDALA